MSETTRETAERLAGPHHQSCEIELAREYHETPSAEDCDCSRREHVQAIEDALREARRQGREEMREYIASRADDLPYGSRGPRGLAVAIRTLPLDGPGESEEG